MAIAMLNVVDTLPLLERGPGQLTAFLADPGAGELARALVALANGDGGTVLLGVETDGQIRGLSPEDAHHTLLSAQNQCRPPVELGWDQVETPLGAVIAISVPRSSKLHSLADGRVLIRTGREDRPLTGDEVRQLAATKSAGDFEG